MKERHTATRCMSFIMCVTILLLGKSSIIGEISVCTITNNNNKIAQQNATMNSIDQEMAEKRKQLAIFEVDRRNQIRSQKEF